jgi:ectoine hydroxylase-related dioxygenase (phytanoyl-CoA dioxygenase family)
VSPTTASAGPLSSAQVESFRRDGYLILEDVLPGAGFTDLVTALRHLAASQGASVGDGEDGLLDALLSLEKKDHEHIRAIHDLVRQSPAINRLADAPALTAAVCQLMGLPAGAPLYNLQRSCRMDMPGDKDFFLDWHQEVHYTFKDARLIQLWAPVTDVTEANGALRILPGSQLGGVAATQDTHPEKGHAQYTVVPEFVARYPEKRIVLKRGSVLLFDKLLVHKSGVNSSARPRLTLITHYHDAARPGMAADVKPPKAVKNPFAK